MSKIFSPGKLLLTSEYFVLDGALALAVPTRLGQTFYCEDLPESSSVVHWVAKHQGTLWLECWVDYRLGKVLRTNNANASAFILKVLLEAKRLSSSRFSFGESYRIETNLEFPSNFGLGSSSTLMNNLAQWAEIDPFTLNAVSLGGSGYDIAVAQKKSPLLYQLQGNERRVESIDISFPFTDQLLFLHLGKKQDSREGIRRFREKQISREDIHEFSELTRKVVSCDSLENFSQLMIAHEAKVSELLALTTVKETYFSQAPVFVKSLGAWGGDFVMTCKFPGYESYFRDKGFSDIFQWSELII